MRSADGGGNGDDASSCCVLAVIFDLDGVIVDSMPVHIRLGAGI